MEKQKYDMDKLFESFKPLEKLQELTVYPEKVNLELTLGEARVLKNIVNDWEEGRSAENILPELLGIVREDIVNLTSKVIRL